MTNDQMQGSLIIISAPSGAGKTTIVSEVLRRLADVRASVSYTSRAPREGEEHSKHYHFVTRAEFEAMIGRNELLEWAEVHGNLYGTSRVYVNQLLDSGLDVILTIDVQGAALIRKDFPEAVTVFVLPPSYDAMLDRLHLRDAGKTDGLELRLHNAEAEVAQYEFYDYLIVNDDLEQAIQEFAAIILAERCRRQKRAATAENILDHFREHFRRKKINA
ncbi:MAG: guanylate kinase [Acidobacteria bacterium]|nr:guanylate kinase [Acidobacteriota bacterium]